MVYDGMLILAFWLVTLFPRVAITNGATVGPTIQTLLFLEMYAFFAYFWLARGQTAGMVAWRLALRSTGSDPVTLKHVTWRFFAAMLCFASLGLGYLWILFDRHKRSWSDMLSGTEIVVLPKQPR